MHKATFLEGTLRFTLMPDGPILIKAGESSGVDPALPDMSFVRTQGSAYIPGPSLKGVVRAQAERICRSLDSVERQEKRLAERLSMDQQDWEAAASREQVRSQQEQRDAPSTEDLAKLRAAPDRRVPLADNPLGDKTDYDGLDDMSYSSGRAIEALGLPKTLARSAVVYRRSSFTSQIFGHTSLAGRVRFADAMPTGVLSIEERNGVAIDRIYGSVAFGPFNYEVVVGGSFASRLDFKNLSLAQIGLLGLALRDLAEGRVGIGFGKSRGLGRVKLSFDSLMLRYPTCTIAETGLALLNGKSICDTDKLAGVGAFARDGEHSRYGFPSDDTAELPAGVRYAADDAIGIGVELLAAGDAQVRAIWRACMPAWKREVWP